jgi:Na+/melibiose symporter-like transporter
MKKFGWLAWVRPALTTPISDKANRMMLCTYGGLVVLVFLMIVMQLLMPGAWFWLFIAVNIPLLALYTTWFIWSVEGYFYRKDIRRQEALRAEFDEMIKRL